MLSVRYIQSVLVLKRAEHPELRASPSRLEMRRVCQREGVHVVRVPTPRPGLYCFDGEWTLLLSSHRPRELDAYWMLHELAHLWLHHNTRSDGLLSLLPNDTLDDRESDVSILCGVVFRSDARARVTRPTTAIAIAALAIA